MATDYQNAFSEQKANDFIIVNNFINVLSTIGKRRDEDR